MNWRLRVQSPAWWATVIIGVAVIIGSYFGVNATDITTWKIFTDTLGAAIANPYVCGSIFVYILTSIFDFSTVGWSDSAVTKAKKSIDQTAEDIVKAQASSEV